MTEAVEPSDRSSTADQLPIDPVELRAVAVMLLVERDAALERCDKLERLLKLANALRHGPSSEKIHPDQMKLGLEDIDQAVGEADAKEDRASPPAREKRAAARRANRGKLPEHLPRVFETLAPAETVCPCCNGALHQIGVDESQRLDIIPAHYQVIVTQRPKMACRTCLGTVLQAAAPERLIKGGLPTERLVAHVIDAKYRWHLPLL